MQEPAESTRNQIQDADLIFIKVGNGIFLMALTRNPSPKWARDFGYVQI